MKVVKRKKVQNRCIFTIIYIFFQNYFSSEIKVVNKAKKKKPVKPL